MILLNYFPFIELIFESDLYIAVTMIISWILVIIVLVTTVIVQILENSFLSPYIMGKSVQIHPVIIIFTLLIGAEIGGIIGMIIAIPTVTICKAIFSKILEIKQQCN